MCQVLAIADDMTGALEVGAKLSQLGSSVSTDMNFTFSRERNVVVIDTETRHVPGEEAAAKIYQIARAARALEIEIVYKKTDSTLRGNVGPEIRALARAYPEKSIVFLPAYPMLGRTVRQGHLLVDGEPVHRSAFAHDALNPVGTSYVLDVLAEGELSPTPGRLEPGHVRVFDSETEADVAAVIKLALAEWPLPVFCGPGSVARHLAAALGCSETLPDRTIVKTAIVVNGSRHEIARRQIQHALRCGWPILSAGKAATSGWTILATDGPAERTAAMVCDVLARNQVDCLVVFGGDTAYAILRFLRKSTVIPVGELFPGIPLSRAGELQLVTKAGGFGPVDLLCKIRDSLSGGR
jgi:uncharacterized protein YgbK (DUF1537 family)